MLNKVTTIQLPLPFRMGLVNCYLIHTDAGYFLIDTGGSNNRKTLLKALESAGCKPGALKLIVLTHGDFDHTGNAAFLRQMFRAKIAMHAGDIPMLERGDMFVGRKQANAILRVLIPLFTGFGKAERCTPDLLLTDGDNLSGHGLDARVVSIPGHSLGSIAILLPSGELFCGDLLENLKNPALGSIMDDIPTAQASLAKLKGMAVKVVYPGHGKAFDVIKSIS